MTYLIWNIYYSERKNVTWVDEETLNYMHEKHPKEMTKVILKYD